MGYENQNISVYINNADIKEKIKELSSKINSDYFQHCKNNESLYAICILKGAVLFYSELVQHLSMPLKMCFVTLSSYGMFTETTGNIKAINLDLPDLSNKNILIVDDIIDTGLTINYFKEYLIRNYNPEFLKVAVLLDKKARRSVQINPDYSAFAIEDKFVMGYGMDFEEKYRNLNYIGYIN